MPDPRLLPSPTHLAIPPQTNAPPSKARKRLTYFLKLAPAALAPDTLPATVSAAAAGALPSRPSAPVLYLNQHSGRVPPAELHS